MTDERKAVEIRFIDSGGQTDRTTEEGILDSVRTVWDSLICHVSYCYIINSLSFIYIKKCKNPACHAVDHVTVYSGIVNIHILYLRNKSALAVNCCIIIHCLEVSCKEDQITRAQREWFISVQLTDKQCIIIHRSRTRADLFRFEHKITKAHLKTSAFSNFPSLHWRNPTKRQNDVTPSNAITDVTFDHYSVANDVKAARVLRTVTLLFHITRFFLHWLYRRGVFQCTITMPILACETCASLVLYVRRKIVFDGQRCGQVLHIFQRTHVSCSDQRSKEQILDFWVVRTPNSDAL